MSASGHPRRPAPAGRFRSTPITDIIRSPWLVIDVAASVKGHVRYCTFSHTNVLMLILPSV
jgi:hypothetical protein